MAEGPLDRAQAGRRHVAELADDRENMLQPGWQGMGMARLPGANFDDIDDGVVWVNHIGPEPAGAARRSTT